MCSVSRSFCSDASASVVIGLKISASSVNKFIFPAMSLFELKMLIQLGSAAHRNYG